MQLKEIILDGSLRELTPRGTPMFPMEMYLNDMDRFITGSVPWHWHEDVELILVVGGEIAIELGGSRYVIESGSGVFVNSNRLHAIRRGSLPECVWISIVFNTEIISGAPKSVFENKYVRPVTGDGCAGVVLLGRDVDWQQDILDMMADAYDRYTAGEEGFEMILRNELSSIWLDIYAHVAPENGGKYVQQSRRVKDIITFIQENYMNDISLDDIAEGSGMGVRTCCRVLKQNIDMTPFEYLTEYRVKVAADILSTTKMSVTEVCYAVGFNSTSYFAKVFREQTGSSPSAYRKDTAV